MNLVIVVSRYSPEWPLQFAAVKHVLHRALAQVPVIAIEHVGSTSVPGLAAKPILDIDVIVRAEDVRPAISALEQSGYVHRGDLGVRGREAFFAPAGPPARSVYVCTEGTLHVRNHLAVRDVLRARSDLRDEYGSVKLTLAGDPGMDIETYLDGKSDVLQRVLAAADLTDAERGEILRLNAPGRFGGR